MYVARVIGNMISTDKYEAFEKRKMLIVQKLGLDNKPIGKSTMALDYVGAGEGDIVLVGAAPGLAGTVFGIPKAPIRELIMGIVDRVETVGRHPDFGNSVPPPAKPEEPPQTTAAAKPAEPKPEKEKSHPAKLAKTKPAGSRGSRKASPGKHSRRKA
jgi:ethanolamine utilization protein EutN